jgi:hypothetical protein
VGCGGEVSPWGFGVFGAQVRGEGKRRGLILVRLVGGEGGREVD